jgi:ArsR family transcriptional regulator
MKVNRKELFEMQADLCGVMSSAKRLMIMDHISQKKEANVGDIAEALDSSVSTISQHLRLMRNKNIVTTRKDGHAVFYSLKHPKMMKGCLAVKEVLLDELRNSGKMADFLEDQVN